jgi:hypothetical protein
VKLWIWMSCVCLKFGHNTHREHSPFHRSRTCGVSSCGPARCPPDLTTFTSSLAPLGLARERALLPARIQRLCSPSPTPRLRSPYGLPHPTSPSPPPPTDGRYVIPPPTTSFLGTFAYADASRFTSDPSFTTHGEARVSV